MLMLQWSSEEMEISRCQTGAEEELKGSWRGAKRELERSRRRAGEEPKGSWRGAEGELERSRSGAGKKPKRSYEGDRMEPVRSQLKRSRRLWRAVSDVCTYSSRPPPDLQAKVQVQLNKRSWRNLHSWHTRRHSYLSRHLTEYTNTAGLNECFESSSISCELIAIG